MDSIECIKTRRSVRKYTDQPIERDTIEKIMEAAAYAPSCWLRAVCLWHGLGCRRKDELW